MKYLLIILIYLNFFSLQAQIDPPCMQLLKGEVRDKISNQLLMGAEVVLNNKNGEKIMSQIVKEDGKFFFRIDCETVFKLIGQKQEYTPESTIFTSTNEDGKEMQLLVSLGKGFIDFVIESKVVETEVKEAKLDSLPTLIVEEKIPTIVQVQEVKEPPIVLPKGIIKDSIKNRHLIKVDNIYFEYESSYLTKQAKTELLKVVNLMKRNPSMIIKIGAHTDANGAEAYNMWLSDRRAKRSIDYIVKRGILANRISGRGYGESEILNRCVDKVDCSEAEHAVNRRTEFVVVKM